MTSTTQETLTGDFVLDTAHTWIGFVVRHAMITKVRGAFGAFDGRLHLDFDNPAASTAEITIDAASINTHNEARDEHLRSADFFDVETFPRISFVAGGIERLDDERYTLTGDLSIKGVTKTVIIEMRYNGTAADPFGNTRVGFEGATSISRSDFGITFNAPLGTGGVLISDRIIIELEISAIKVSTD